MTGTDSTEDRLSRVLQVHADRAGGPDFPLERVRHRAHRIRRGRRIGTAAAACVAVAAVVIPIGLTFGTGNEGAQAPTPAESGPPSPTRTAKQSPSPWKTPSPHRTRGSNSAIDDLTSIPRGRGTFLSYVGADGVVHDDGSTARLPEQPDPSTQLLAFRDGWLVAGPDNKLREYDSSGKVVASGRFGGMTLTDDRTRAAWIMGGKLFQSGLSTMSEGIGPQAVPVPASAGLIGYLPQGPALSGSPRSIRIATGSGTLQTVHVGLFPTTTSQAADLVGGSIGTPAQGNLEGAVYDVRTHTRLWHNGWQPLRFSDDGSLVAAFPADENGDPSAIAILDARTGKVIARTPKLEGLYPGRDVAWDGRRLIIPAVGGGQTKAALLALDTSGHLTRVSDVEKAARPGGAYLIFAAQP